MAGTVTELLRFSYERSFTPGYDRMTRNNSPAYPRNPDGGQLSVQRSAKGEYHPRSRADSCPDSTHMVVYSRQRVPVAAARTVLTDVRQEQTAHVQPPALGVGAALARVVTATDLRQRDAVPLARSCRHGGPRGYLVCDRNSPRSAILGRSCRLGGPRGYLVLQRSSPSFFDLKL